MSTAPNTQIIYYDPDDADMDGLGWNVVDDAGAIAARYGTLFGATSACERWGFQYVVLFGWDILPCSNCGKPVREADGLHAHSKSYNCDGEGV